MGKNKKEVIVLSEEESALQVADLIDKLAEELISECNYSQPVWHIRIIAPDGVSNNPDTIKDLFNRLTLLSNRLPDYDNKKQGYLNWVLELIEEKLEDVPEKLLK